jgi:hypothetical protein
MMILEENEKLRLLDGIGIEDLTPRKPFSITYSPTRWGRVSVLLEPIETKAWSVTFKREDFDATLAPKLSSIEMPRHLPGNFQFVQMVGTDKFIKNGPRIVIEPTELKWQGIYRYLSRY